MCPAERRQSGGGYVQISKVESLTPTRLAFASRPPPFRGGIRACRAASYLNENFAVLHNRAVGLDRHHAGRRNHFSGLDVELAVVKVAFDHIAFDIAFRR